MFSGLTNPTAVRFASDGRVFVAEKRGVIKVFDSLTDTTPTTFADLNVNVYNFWDRGLLGMTLAPNFPTNPYVYVLYTYDAAIGGTAPRWGTPGVYSDPCPTPPGPTGRRLRGQRAPVAPAGRRQCDDRRRAGADRGLVPAVPQPLDRRGGVRPRRGAVRQRRRRGQLQLRRLRPGRQPAESLRRPAGRGRRHADPPHRRRRRAAQPGPAHQRRPGHPGRHHHPRRPGHRRGAAEQPAGQQPPTPTPGGSSPTGCATPSASPSAPAPPSCGWGTSAGTTGRRSTAS